MDPLSAYRMSAMPGLSPAAMARMEAMGAPGAGGAGGMAGLPGVGGADGFAKVIPKAEMDALQSSGLQPRAFVPPTVSPSGHAVQGASFSNFLGNMVNDVSAKQVEAGAAMKGVIAGNGVPLHQAMIAVEEASVSFQLMVEVRNRLLESYQELMRMQV
jgi:flagellar hook-basal body complex protein FliE